MDMRAGRQAPGGMRAARFVFSLYQIFAPPPPAGRAGGSGAALADRARMQAGQDDERGIMVGPADAPPLLIQGKKDKSRRIAGACGFCRGLARAGIACHARGGWGCPGMGMRRAIRARLRLGNIH